MRFEVQIFYISVGQFVRLCDNPTEFMYLSEWDCITYKFHFVIILPSLRTYAHAYAQVFKRLESFGNKNALGRRRKTSCLGILVNAIDVPNHFSQYRCVASKGSSIHRNFSITVFIKIKFVRGISFHLHIQ